MKNVLAATLAVLMAACSATALKTAPPQQLPEAYIPKHPELNLPEPTFRPIPLIGAKKITAYIQNALEQEPQSHKNLIAFVEIAGGMYINAHRAEIMACTDAKGNRAGPGMADPECVWQRPMADDWVGCMAYQFAGAEAEFNKFNLSSLKEDETVFIWIDRNYDTITKDPDGMEFIIQLNGLPILGAQCDKIVQGQVPAGSISVNA